MPDHPAPLPLVVALRVVVAAAVDGQDRIGLLTAVLAQPADGSSVTSGRVLSFPQPRRPLDDGPDAA
jgi:hypothetical protein